MIGWSTGKIKLSMLGGSRTDVLCFVCFFQAEDGIRDLVRSRGLGDVYKRQLLQSRLPFPLVTNQLEISPLHQEGTLDGTLDQCLSLIHI